MIPIPSRGADETWFTGYLLAVFQDQGLQAVHIRETETPGPTDMLVWQGAEILAWVENKIGAHAIEISQKEFIRDRDREAGNAFVFRLRKAERFIECYRGLEDVSFDRIYEPQKTNWKLWFWQNRRDATRYK